MQTSKKFKLMILPGNGFTNIKKGNWYWWLCCELRKKFPENGKIICKTMPDPYEAKEKFWIPFIKNEFEEDKESYNFTYIVGHSSGAVCIMRLLETYKLTGAVIVAGCVSHLGYEEEFISGYYPFQPNKEEIRPWLWSNMKENSNWIIEFSSQDDQFIPIEEMREIKEKLNLSVENYIEFDKSKKKGHFMQSEFNELRDLLIERINKDLES